MAARRNSPLPWVRVRWPAMTRPERSLVPRLLAPAARPCGSCPYRRDAPAQVWEPSEYELLPLYDLPTGRQPQGVFRCHQTRDAARSSRACAGWLHTHNQNPAGHDLLGLRVAVFAGLLTEDQARTFADYRTDVPCFTTGAEAAARGLGGPITDATRAVVHKVMRRRPGVAWPRMGARGPKR